MRNETRFIMMLELTEQERDVLARLLTSARTETAAGIHHAMDHETRETLRAERTVLEQLLDRLGATAEAVR